MATTATTDLEFHGNDGELGTAIVAHVVEGAALEDFGIRVRTDVTVRESTLFVALAAKLMRAGTACGTSANNGALAIDERWLEPDDVEIEDTYCAHDFDKLIKGLKLKVGVKLKDLTGTQVETILKELYGNVWIHDLRSLALNGDKAAAVAFYASTDGAFKQLIAGVAETTAPHKVKRFNTGTSTLAANAVRDTVLPGMYAAQDTRMQDVPDEQKRFVLNAAMWENYYQSFVGTTLESMLVTLESGKKALTYRGIKVVKAMVIDEAITDLTITTKNRGYLTVDNNIECGLDTDTEDAVMELIYDKITKKNIIRINHKMGVNYADGAMTVVAY